MSSATRDCRIYVGNLPPDVRSKDVEDVFSKYGKIVFVDLKNRGKGPPFSFLEFDDQRDAEDAVRGRDGYDFDGYRLRVEFPKGVGPRGPGGRPMEGSDGRTRSNYYPPRGGGGGAGGGGNAPGRRTGYRALVSGLPPTGSWQDLKDHMREAGDVTYADVFRDGTGVVEYLRHDDLKYAIRKLDDTKFRSHEGETSYVRVKEYDGAGGSSSSVRRSSKRSRSRSESPPRRSRASPTYSPARRSRSRSRSDKRSRSRSDASEPSRNGKSKSRSASRSRSRSKS